MRRLFLTFNLIVLITFMSPSSYSEVTERPEIKHSGQTRLDLFRSTSNFEITSEEWQRYETLSNGLRGFQSPKLDSLTSLAIEARNDAERRHYAELWVKQEYERTEKEFKFQREIDAAWKRLMPNMLPVNMGNAAGIAHDSGGAARTIRARSGLPALRRAGRYSTAFPPSEFANDESPVNHDGGRWMRYGNGIMPVLLQQGESGWHIAAF